MQGKALDKVAKKDVKVMVSTGVAPCNNVTVCPLRVMASPGSFAGKPSA
jgi:hypothetical protein